MPFARAQIVWVIVACLAWKFGVVNESRGLGRESLASVLLVMSSFGVGLGALVVALSDRAQKWLAGWRLFGVFTFFFVMFGVLDAVARSRIPYTMTTDAHVYMDYAARLVTAGKNPYDTSLYGGIVVTHTPIEFQTPLDNGGLSDRLAYPSLSFLYLVPFLKLGIPTNLAYAVALFGCFAILYRVAPADLRPLVLLPFFADESYLWFAYGGITDTGWALLLCGVVVAWKRPRLAAFLFGLACAYKQHPWLLAPFLAIRIARETPSGEADRRTVALRRIGSFFGIAALTFAVLNLPFLLWSPKAWFLGVVEPLASSMVPLGEGVSSLLPLAGAAVPKAFFSLAFWGFFLILLLVCATWKAGKVFLWIAPSIAFFLNFRSLSSYWYFNVLPFVVELVLDARGRTADDRAVREPAAPPLVRVPWRRLVPLLVIGAVFFTAFAAWASRRKNASVELLVELPMRTYMSNVYRLDVKLTNHGDSPVTPRFWVQGQASQPLPWHAAGPGELAPGQTASYALDAPSPIAQMAVARGGRLTVTDLASSLRKSIDIPPDAAELSIHAIPNPDYRFWDVNGGAPTYWAVGRLGSPGAHASPLESGPHRGVELTLEPDVEKLQSELFEYCTAVATCYASKASLRYEPPQSNVFDHRVELTADFAARPRGIALWTRTPKNANVAPTYDERYGMQLWFGGRAVTVLFGGDAGQGVFADGTPYVVMPGARETWTRLTIDLGELQHRFAPNVYPKMGFLWRFPMIDQPVIQTRLSLVYAARTDLAASAQFGAIQDSVVGKDRENDEIALLDEHPGAVDAWRSGYEWGLKNPTRAKLYLARARRNESHAELDLQAAFQALQTNEPAEAERLFVSLVAVLPVDANIGLALCAMGRHQPDVARTHYETALAELAKASTGRPLTGEEQLQRLGMLLGLADTQTMLGDCQGAVRTLRDVPKAEREARERRPDIIASTCH